MDIYGELGKFMREIDDNQDILWKSITERALHLCKYEEEVIQIEK